MDVSVHGAGCGEPNMYMLPYRCKVTGVTGDAAVAPGTPAVWCEDDPSQCIPGAKQMIYWNQAEGNNIEVIGTDLAGSPKSPAYNAKLGFVNGMFYDPSYMSYLWLKMCRCTDRYIPGSRFRHAN
ncbi:hypothetical protein C0993_002290 [Termitomyces sp. T159_Od127]|nr:hypothetical protein C0993_002290 [Termitomyces sp. T159_Od127]